MERKKSKKSNKKEKNNTIIIIVVLLVALLAVFVYKYYNRDTNDIDITFADNNIFIYNGKTYRYKLIDNDKYIEFCDIDYCSKCKMSVNIEQLIEFGDDEEVENRCFDDTFDVSIKSNKKLVEKILEHEKEKNK